MPAMMYEITMAGPANCAAAVPVSTKMPAPIMAPIPSVIRLMGPSARFSECSPPPAASARIFCMGLVANNGLDMHILRGAEIGWALSRKEHRVCMCGTQSGHQQRTPLEQQDDGISNVGNRARTASP